MTEVARLRRRFSFVLQQALSFRTRHHLCRQGVALASTRRPHSQGPASVQAHRTGGVTGSEGQEGANGVGGGIGVGSGNGDGNGDVDGHGDGDGAGAGAGTGVEVNEGAQDGNGDGAGTGTEERTVAEMGTGTTKTGTRIGLGRAEGRRKSARNRKIAVDAVRETGETWVESEKNVEKKRVGLVAANPDNLGSNKEAVGGAQGAQGSNKICTSRESVSPLSRLIGGFQYH